MLLFCDNLPKNRLMTRNKEAAQRFWFEVDKAMQGTEINLYGLADAAGVPYKSILSWRQKHLFPDLETACRIAYKVSCPIDKLMGRTIQFEPALPPRLKAVIGILASDEKKLVAVETLLRVNEKETGSSGTKAS